MKKGVDYTGITVVFACHDGVGNYLFAKRSINCRDEHGTWDPGGGAMEFGDSPEATLIKEIKEEYCTTVLDFIFMGYRNVVREQEGVKTHWLALDYKVLVDRTAVGVGEPEKTDGLEWFRLSEVPDPVHSQWPTFYGKYFDILNAH